MFEAKLSKNPVLKLEVFEDDGTTGTVDLLEINPDPSWMLKYAGDEDNVPEEEKTQTLGVLHMSDIDFFENGEKLEVEEAAARILRCIHESIIVSLKNF